MSLTRALGLVLLVLLVLGAPARVRSQSTLVNGSLVVVGTVNYCEPASGSNAYACTFLEPLAAYTPGAHYAFRADVANTGPASININSIGLKVLKRVQGGITTDLVANDIQAGQVVEVYYDGTNMQVTSPLGQAPASGQVFNVRDYGLKGDGIFDNTSAMYAVVSATGGTRGAVIYFPPGDYVINGVSLYYPDLTFRGAGPGATTIRTTVASFIFSVLSAPSPMNLTFEHLHFDGTNIGTMAFADTQDREGRLTVRQCKFTRFVSYGLYVTASNFVIEDNLFEGEGKDNASYTAAKAVLLVGPLSRGAIRNNRIRYVQDGVIGDTGAGALEENTELSISDVEFSGNSIDLGFYTSIARATNAGTVTYSNTTVQDTGASFTGVADNDFVRVMPTKESIGTATVVGQKVTITGATMKTAPNIVFPGEFIRVGGKFGIIDVVWTDEVLSVEEWLSETDRSVVNAPDSGAYTIYGVYLGKLAAATSTSTLLTVARWMDLNGTTLVGTPPFPIGTRYELLPKPGNYAFHCEYGCRNWRIHGNSIKRAYSDLISFYGSYSTITGNSVFRGQDTGITVNGTYNTVVGNRVDALGALGIGSVNGTNLVISSNTISNTGWELISPAAGGLWIYGGSNNLLANNMIGIEPTYARPQAKYGIVLLGGVSGTILEGNVTRGHSLAGILLDGAGGAPTGTRKLSHTSVGEPVETVLNSGASYVNLLRSLYVPAGSMDVLGACTLGSSTALVTNGPKLPALLCTASDSDGLEIEAVMPDGWDGGPLTVELVVFYTGTAHNTQTFDMNFSGQCVTSGGVIAAQAITSGATAESPTNVQAVVTASGVANRELHATTGALTLAGTCAGGAHVYVRGFVDVGGTSFTPLSDLKILGVKIEYARASDD